MRARCSRIILSGVVLLAVSAPVSANLLVNPNFAGSLSPWAGVGVYDAGNSHTADGSGSQLSTLNNPLGVDDSIGAGTSQCVGGIVAGTNYQFGGYASLEPSTPGTQGGAVVNVQWFSDTACSTFITQTGTFGITTQETPTFVYTRIANLQVAPAGTQSVLVVSSVLNNQDGPSSFTVRFDDLFLQAATAAVPALPAAPVPALDAFGIACLTLIIALGSWKMLRRRLVTD